MYLITLAGIPAIIELLGTSLLTTDPAATIDPSLTLTPGNIVDLEPIYTYLPILIAAG